MSREKPSKIALRKPCDLRGSFDGDIFPAMATQKIGSCFQGCHMTLVSLVKSSLASQNLRDS